MSRFSLNVLIALGGRISLMKVKLPGPKANVPFLLKFPNDFHISSIVLGTQWTSQFGNSELSIRKFFLNNFL